MAQACCQSQVLLGDAVSVDIGLLLEEATCGPQVNFTTAEAMFVQSTTIFENHLNPVMLVFVG